LPSNLLAAQQPWVFILAMRPNHWIAARAVAPGTATAKVIMICLATARIVTLKIVRASCRQLPDDTSC
jgi:hypothetical protein